MGPTLIVSDVRVGTESRQLATCTVDGSLRVRNLNPSERSVLRGHDDYVYSARWLAGGKQVVSGSWDGSVRIWDVETRAELAKIDAEREVPMPAKLTP